MSTKRADLRDARCSECGARCLPGETHAEHNAGWLKKVLMWDWHELALEGYPGWDLVESGGEKHPPFVKLSIRNGKDKSSEDITREFDDVAKGRFYGRDWSHSGSPFVRKGEVYDAGWWFEKREDAIEFMKRYGSTAQ
jgi:hypothetical protein